MPFPRARAVNPRLGTYFGIFTSAFASLVLLLLILEQLGIADATVRGVMLGGPLALYALMGLAAACQEPLDFFASGRRAPAVYNGLVLAVSAAGGTGLVAITGLFFLHGFDAWCLVIGLTAGLVTMAILIVPYLRKFGAYTLPSYLGRRFDSPFGSVGPLSFVLTSLTLMAGVAAAPWLLPRSGTTPTVYDARKSLGWATFVLGALMVTASAVAVFLRDMVMDTLVGQSVNRLPEWFRTLSDMGFAAADGHVPRLPLMSFSFKRDAVLFALP